MEQIAENESVLQSDGNAGEKEVKKKPRIKRKTLREYLFVYGMLLLPLIRSEERRGGKECRVKCRSRWSPDH